MPTFATRLAEMAFAEDSTGRRARACGPGPPARGIYLIKQFDVFSRLFLASRKRPATRGELLGRRSKNTFPANQICLPTDSLSDRPPPFPPGGPLFGLALMDCSPTPPFRFSYQGGQTMGPYLRTGPLQKKRFYTRPGGSLPASVWAGSNWKNASQGRPMGYSAGLKQKIIIPRFEKNIFKGAALREGGPRHRPGGTFFREFLTRAFAIAKRVWKNPTDWPAGG